MIFYHRSGSARAPAGLPRRIFRLAGPIMLASLAGTLMSLIDIAMVGRLGAAAVAAVGLGGIITYAVSSFLNAIQAGVQTVIARRVGAGQDSAIGETMRSVIIFSLLVGTLLGVLIYAVARPLFPLLVDDGAVVEIGSAYLQWRSLSLGLVMGGFVFYAFYNGVSRPGIHLIVSLVAYSLNVALNYALIFGHWGLPAMGAPGAGLATTISTLVAFLLYAGYTFSGAISRKYPGIWLGRIRLSTLAKVIEISTPTAFQNFGVMIGFALFMVIMGKVSTMALAATEIVFNILSFSFMPAMGFLFATQTLVSENIGRGDLDQAVAVVRSATVQCMLLMGSMGVLFLVIPGLILQIFTPETALINSAVMPLMILGLVQFLDAISMVHLGALRGAGDNVFTAVAELILMWVFFLPVTYFTALHWSWGILGGWIALAIYIAVFAGLLRYRFKTGIWRSIKV